MHSKGSEKKQKQQRKKHWRRKKVAHTAKEKLSPRQSGTLSLAKNSIFIRKTCNRNWMYLWDCKKRNEMKIIIEKKTHTKNYREKETRYIVEKNMKYSNYNMRFRALCIFSNIQKQYYRHGNGSSHFGFYSLCVRLRNIVAKSIVWHTYIPNFTLIKSGNFIKMPL